MDQQPLDYDDLCKILALIDALPSMAEIDVTYQALEVHVERDEPPPPAPAEAS